MEENFDQKPCMCYDPLTLQHTEKSFYDVLELDPALPLSPNQHPLESPDGNSSNSTTDSAISQDLKPHSPDTPVSVSAAADAFISSSLVPPHDLTGVNDGVLDLDSSAASKLMAENIFSDADSMLQFRRGLEEASKFLPQRPQLFTGKNHARQDEEEGGRSNKQSAGCAEEESEISEMFDRVLLSVENVPLCAEHKSGPVAVGDGSTKSEQTHVFDGGKVRSKKQGKKKETVDLRTLLVLCAQAVSASDNRTANELLKQIRQHSTPLGDASQRLAHYVANGLEARLVGAGTGTQIFYMSHKKFTAADYLKAYQVFISACPFKKFSHFFANKMILKTAEKAETLHIIDFGILYGFQWPILIRFLSSRSGGPAKLRITGIEYPQAGFRPAERIEETGRRLAKYCERFNVPFEYNAIASRNWETIQIEDLKIQSNEVVAVNCLIRFKNLLDESIEVKTCEALERVERPESYKQWQARNTRAGFKQLPLDKEIMAKFRGKLKEWYHKDFVFDEDCNWMLQGWKGRILYASSCWVPA
uniref:Scarecrow-like protein 14 n=1 Tax=Cajanus cajan TaxID=3821 RepID=A0A151SUR0_CAJCA|nr:Scarecrow-like protein 14 [Cajanus cajan]